MTFGDVCFYSRDCVSVFQVALYIVWVATGYTRSGEHLVMGYAEIVTGTGCRATQNLLDKQRYIGVKIHNYSSSSLFSILLLSSGAGGGGGWQRVLEHLPRSMQLWLTNHLVMFVVTGMHFSTHLVKILATPLVFM